MSGRHPPAAFARSGPAREDDDGSHQRPFQALLARARPGAALLLSFALAHPGLEHVHGGRVGRQKASGYIKRARVGLRRHPCMGSLLATAEAAISRHKRAIGDGPHSRADSHRVTEVAVSVHALDRMIEFARPKHVRTP